MADHKKDKLTKEQKEASKAGENVDPVRPEDEHEERGTEGVDENFVSANEGSPEDGGQIKPEQ